MQKSVAAAYPGGGASAWHAALAGLCASFAGLGLGRFAYTPLIPALIGAGWFTPSEAVYLGAANLAGYLAGALSGGRLAASAPTASVLRAMMLLVAATFLAGAFPLSFPWFFVWRFASGFAGGVLVVLGFAAVLSRMPALRRGLVGGAIFAGVGLGIVASGTLVPLLMRLGLVETWVALGALSLLLAGLSWGGWPAGASPVPPATTRAARPRSSALAAFYVEYGLIAVALVPHMVFLVDFIARGLGRGLDTGARYWVLFGVSAALGPVLAGHLADRIGVGMTVRLALIAEAASVALPAFADGDAALAVSSIVVGAFVPGVAGLAISRVHELASTEGAGRQAAWGVCTTAFALGQAAAAYGFSFLFAASGSYRLLFALGAAALGLALAIDVVAAAREARTVDPRGDGT